MADINQMTYKFMYLLILTFIIHIQPTKAKHFRGGTISWKSEGGLNVRIYYKIGWKYNSAGCTKKLIGQFVKRGHDKLQCLTGCLPTQGVSIHDTHYYCTGANQAQQWEQGQNDFLYTFSHVGDFTVGYATGNWIPLSNGKGNGLCNLHAKINLRIRSDTGEVNSSPECVSKPIYYVDFNSKVTIKVPVIDADNDRIRCRWAVGNECESVCDALPAATLDGDNCIISFNTIAANNYSVSGQYAVALTIEDFPQSDMTMDGIKMTTKDAISYVPVQFLVTTIQPIASCNSKPRFLLPTPKESKTITIEEGDTANVGIFADNGVNGTCAKANKITASGVVGLKVMNVIQDSTRREAFTTNITWSPRHSDLGNHIVCALVENDLGKSGSQRCFNIRVVQKGCKAAPCLNNGKCAAHGGNYTCTCRPGFQGFNCEININDCVSNPCPMNQICVDGINSYTCNDPASNVNDTTGSLLYNKCECFVGNLAKMSHRLETSIMKRDFKMGSIGLPLGFALSIITICLLELFKPGFLTNFKKARQRKPTPHPFKKDKHGN